jgi:AraC-type DNA-binding domain-containing proteins
MGYSLYRVEEFGAPFQILHEQNLLAPAHGHLPVMNPARKVLLVLSGECRHRVMGWEGPWADVHLRAGDVLVLPHRCEQRYSAVETGSASRLHVVRLSFDPERLPPLTLPSGREPAPPQPGTPPDADDAAPGDPVLALADDCLRQLRYLRRVALDADFQETLSHLRDEARRCAPGYRLRIYGLCVSLTVLLSRRLSERRPDEAVDPPTGLTDAPAGGSYHVGAVKDYLRTHLSGAPRLAGAAAYAGLSPEYTARLFKKATGMTVSEYIRRLRVDEAKNLLATTEKNLSEIARATGYASLTVFSRNFKREAGQTPSQYRQDIARQMG